MKSVKNKLDPNIYEYYRDKVGYRVYEKVYVGVIIPLAENLRDIARIVSISMMRAGIV
jgi:hypothetical protein